MMDWIDGTLPGSDAGHAPLSEVALLRQHFCGRAALLVDVRSRLARGIGFSIATLNLDHLVKLRADPAFRSAYLAQTHVTADGNPIVWLERLAGREVELVPGSELVLPLVRIAADLDLPVALVGTTPASLAGASEALLRAVPGVRIKAAIAPPMGFDPASCEAAAIVDRLRKEGVRLCLVAMGAPRQERFASFAMARMPETGFASVGAGLDFLSGHQRRAPRIMRTLALEWLWRLAAEPRRLASRYAACILLMPRLTVSALRARRLGGQPARGET